MKIIVFIYLLFVTINCFSQLKSDSIVPVKVQDSINQRFMDEIVITASRISERILSSPVSIDYLNFDDAQKMASLSCFDALENLKGVHIITPSLGYKVVNARGFANTTNVRFAQLIDGVDNQSPHIGAPIANALGANDLDINKIEITSGTASALYGINAINGMVNILTKNPFIHQGVSIQQLTGINHIGNINTIDPKLFSQTNFRYAQAFRSKFALKVNGSYTNGTDWFADNRADLAPTLNAATNLIGNNNPAFDEVNSYGNESPNRRTLTLDGKKYVVARTGYREIDIENYDIKNYKGDIGIYYRPKNKHELSFTYKGALINTIYQRSNRFRLKDYTLHQYVFEYHSDVFLLRTYFTQENTGKSYNLRSLAENLDRAFKQDDEWFSDYVFAYNNALANGLSVTDAHKFGRSSADNGRYEVGNDSYEQKKEDLVDINNWDKGAALRVKSYLSHSEGTFSWDKLFPDLYEKMQLQIMNGFDHRTYIIIPDGNYFINPVDSGKNLFYCKTGGFIQLNKNLLNKKLRLSITIRADKADYFDWKVNPRITAFFSPKEELNFRIAYQSGYRFPSIFEGFSNINSGGVKRVGGLNIMSNGVFENSYTKTSIDVFQFQVNSDINTLGLTQEQAIEKNKGLLKKNPYTYLEPEHVSSFELGFRGLALKKSLFLDADIYYNSYDNFIAQVEANIPKTSNSDSIPTYLYIKSKQDRYRLWTNSQSKIYNYGLSLGLKFKYNEKLSFLGNIAYSKLDQSKNKDGLEDGYNTPEWMLNATFITDNIWKNLGASMTARYHTKFEYVSFLVNGTVPAYCTLDTQINYQFKQLGIVIKVGANNLLNKYYYSMLGGSSIGGLYYISLNYAIKK